MKNKYTELINQLSDRELLFHLYATQVLLVVLSLIFGFFLFNDFTEFLQLFNWNDINILLIGGSAALLIVATDLFLMKVLPEKSYDDGGLNKRIFSNKKILHIAFIAAIVALGEEIFFRGVIQTHFGLLISSTIFALVHYRYLFNWFLFLNIILLSFFIGFIYLWTENLSVTIFMHFLIDFLLGVYIKYKTPEREEMLNE
ncbi:CPBP family intramembrane glutamic endopeptidase [Mesobacillus harenae]|uniref:CPBP family intramembrane glutamic endopeptidase n=1 Tax=Mesobacillus harenae TaxID=2213203 RepID=UPI001580043A|nr:type II CAAX endopeptidase family protein [Mesobacillus harenae]